MWNKIIDKIHEVKENVSIKIDEIEEIDYIVNVYNGPIETNPGRVHFFLSNDNGEFIDISVDPLETDYLLITSIYDGKEKKLIEKKHDFNEVINYLEKTQKNILSTLKKMYD